MMETAGNVSPSLVCTCTTLRGARSGGVATLESTRPSQTARCDALEHELCDVLCDLLRNLAENDLLDHAVLVAEPVDDPADQLLLRHAVPVAQQLQAFLVAFGQFDVDVLSRFRHGEFPFALTHAKSPKQPMHAKMWGRRPSIATRCRYCMPLTPGNKHPPRIIGKKLQPAASKGHPSAVDGNGVQGLGTGGWKKLPGSSLRTLDPRP